MTRSLQKTVSQDAEAAGATGASSGAWPWRGGRSDGWRVNGGRGDGGRDDETVVQSTAGEVTVVVVTVVWTTAGDETVAVVTVVETTYSLPPAVEGKLATTRYRRREASSIPIWTKLWASLARVTTPPPKSRLGRLRNEEQHTKRARGGRSVSRVFKIV